MHTHTHTDIHIYVRLLAYAYKQDITREWLTIYVDLYVCELSRIKQASIIVYGNVFTADGELHQH